MKGYKAEEIIGINFARRAHDRNFHHGHSQKLLGNVATLARTLLEACLRPDTDLLLPDVDATSEQGLFFVVMYTHAQGVEVIGRHI